jgi:ABC-type branched-subunit amino acid transport system substrate-binding protein
MRHLAVACIAAVTMVGTGVLTAPAGAQGGSVPGVTAKEIEIGAVIGKTNPTGVKYGDVVVGAQMYFDKVNKAGGVFGKKFKIVKTIDDQTRSSKSILAARSLIEEEKVFAALHASQVFAGADQFVKAGMPVFGYNIQTEWSKGPNLFGTYGSYLCFTCPSIATTYTAQQLGAKNPAVFAYGSSPSSSSCATTLRDGFDKWGPKTAVYDTSLSFGFSANDISGAVQAIKDNQVDFVATCMDLNGLVNIKKAVEDAGIQGVNYYAPQGYDKDTLEQLGEEVQGLTFLAQFLPFEAAKGSPGMTEFLAAVKKKGLDPSENLLVGWIGAALLTEGIQAAGKDFTQASVIEAINQITDWTADGMMSPVDWTSAHGPAVPGTQDCNSYLVAKGDQFVVSYAQPNKPYVCFPVNPYSNTLEDRTYKGVSDFSD